MGHSRDEKRESHERILSITARRIRESGTERPGLVEIMREAGLTHGGFYKHFGSRDELVTEAGRRALSTGAQATRAPAQRAADPHSAYVESYLSTDHRDAPGSGCGLVALGGDAAHGASGLRAAYGEQVQAVVATLTELAGATGDDAADRRRATLEMSALVGAMLIARAVEDSELSAQILADVRTALIDAAPADAGAQASGSGGVSS